MKSGGSSGGAAVAFTLDLAWAAVGSEVILEATSDFQRKALVLCSSLSPLDFFLVKTFSIDRRFSLDLCNGPISSFYLLTHGR